jgi:hypothetical protein
MGKVLGIRVQDFTAGETCGDKIFAVPAFDVARSP